MSKLKAIIALEEQIEKDLQKAKNDASLIIDEQRVKAEEVIETFAIDIKKEIEELKVKENKEIKLLEEKLYLDKAELNKNFEERFEDIVNKYVNKLKDEVTKL